MTRLGLQLPSFTFPGGDPAEVFPIVAAAAQAADHSGFDTVLVMDHFYQLPMLGAPDEPMLEAYTALGALATATERVLLGTLVTGNTYRNPTLLAKIITTLDVVSAGRAVLGLGTGWFELEHEQLGFEFGTFTERFAKLDEALQIVLPMLGGERVSFTGDFYRTDEAVAVPRYRDHIPLMIGGSGEKKTFGLAARYFDHLNVIATFGELPGKVDALKRRCEEADRDPATLETSVLLTAVPDPDFSDDLVPAAMRGRVAVGSPDRTGETVRANVVDVGIDGVVVNLPAYRPGSIAAIGEALRPVVGA